ncbi:hypothetical protein BURCENK562V_C4861 [Burkholderia cenocepacia K56-2Valvano]|nr:hypothetical protein BURCENK562V_C4861 [Burkholderia cenocepacia K56-2Valvano]
MAGPISTRPDARRRPARRHAAARTHAAVIARHAAAIATRRPNLRHCRIVADRHATEDARA